MKKTLIITLLAVTSLLTACGNAGQHQNGTADSAKTSKTGKQYTCPMHADVIKDKRGTCPKCGMDLVEKDK